MRPSYDRNSLTEILETAKSHGLEIKTHQLMTIGEREPDYKIVDAARIGFKITVLEAFENNVKKIRKAWPHWSYLHLDVRQLPQHPEIELAACDLIWWYHGPEHLPKEEGLKVFEYLKQHSCFIIGSMPHGDYPQVADYGNPYEEHVSAWYESDFQRFGGVVYTETDKGDDKTSLDVFIKGDLLTNGTS